MKKAVPFLVPCDSPDIPAILELLHQSFAYMEPRIIPRSSLHSLTIETISEFCVSNEIWTIGEPPKACVFLKEHHDCLYLGKLAVDGKARKCGYARQLVELAEERAVFKNLPALEVEIRIELIENHEAFRRLGFVKTSEGAHDGFDRITYIVMRKEV